MKQDMILILDLGSTENPMIAREIRAMGVYTEIHPHDITAEELELPTAPVDVVGILAAKATEQAVIRAVKAAK